MPRTLVAAALAAASLAATVTAAERNPHHDLVASSHGRSVQASLGSHCTVTDDSMLCADHSYPLPAARRLPVHGGGRIVLKFGARPEEIHPELRDRRSRRVRELTARGTGRRRTIRLPGTLPRGSDRLGVFVTYDRGDADFEVDLKRHRHR